MRWTPRNPALVTAMVLLAAALATVSEATRGGNIAAAPSRADLQIRADTLVLPPVISARLASARAHLVPSGIRKLEQIGRRLAPDIAAGTGFGPLRTRAEHEVVASFPGLTGKDAAQAAFIVLAMAAEDMDDEMRTILSEVDATTRAKEKMRDMIAELNAWIAREMARHSEAGDLDNQTPISGGPGPTPAVPLRPQGLVTLETRTSPVAGIRYLHVLAIPPLPAPVPAPTFGELRALRDAHVATLAKLEPLSAKVVAGLRRLLEYRSKAISDLSDMMAKMATTQDTLAQNLK